MNTTHSTLREIPTDRSVWLALLGNEWRSSLQVMSALIVLWVIGLWILVLFSHPGWLLALGLLYCLLAAGVQAGSDVICGTEEFSFALPPGRGPLFLARLVPGLAFILVVGGFGGLAMAADLPQRAWSLVFSSGLTVPFAPVRDRWWYPLAVCLPLAVFAITFVGAALARSRAAVGFAWLAGFLGGGVLMGLGMLAETLLWQEVNGLVSCPALVAAAVLVLLGGYQLYLRKEATKSGGQATGAGGFLIWVMVTVGVVLMLLLLSAFFFRMKAVSVDQHEIQRQEANRALQEEQRSRAIKETKTVQPPPPVRH